MLYNRTYIDKCATIVDGSDLNTGYNPVAELVYGRNVSRILVHFDHRRIKRMFDDKCFPDISKLRHTLRMKNAGSLDTKELHKTYTSQIDGCGKIRTSSFDLIFFLIPSEWDCGKGFDYTRNYYSISLYDRDTYGVTQYLSSEGANWFSPVTGGSWKKEIQYQETVDEQFDFFIKADRQEVGKGGGTVTFSYFCCCNGERQNKDIEFKVMNNTFDNPVKVGTPVHFSAGGQVCHNDADILKYGRYVRVTVDFPRNTSGIDKKFAFRLEYKVGDRTFSSNQYRIILNGTEPVSYPVTDYGVYSTETLDGELEKFEKGEESIVIGKQHFDIGAEDIELDITDTFNRFITGELDNHGIGIAYAPSLENIGINCEKYVGFITNRTNTFFEPYVDTVYEESVADDRGNFVLGRKNRLYLYANIGGNLENLDTLPTCNVEGEELEVHQGGKGIYYAELTLPENAFPAPTMLYDTWDGIMYHGETLRPVELEFTTKQERSYFSVGSSLPEKAAFLPTCYGISDEEHIMRGDVRKVCFQFRKEYTRNTAVYVNEIEVMLYIMDGNARITVMPYIKAERSFTDTYVMIDTSILIPNTYHMDVRVRYGMEMIEHHDVLRFTIDNEES